ncbi:DnaB-like helicase N-terminal domain-containing protein [Longispora sp. NPDC051575]|uniref:DnaB-like helicase N-terminal domain-containing protein n=1 Tax=Longispora sp. NPDC051575 TaxID=3154943 RepID=UPI003419D0B3
MSDLIMRAEQGVLGALLANTERSEALYAELSADDFAHPAHQAIYIALADLQYTAHTVDELTVKVAVLTDRTDVEATWLAGLAAAAPEGPHVLAYARIVIAASCDRDLAGFAQPYLAAAEATVDAEARAHLLRTASALAAQDVFAEMNAVNTDRTVVITTAHVDVTIELSREEQVIADVIQHPEQARNIGAWLEPDVFTTDQTRTCFELAVSLAYDGDLVDPVVLAWDLERARQISALYGHDSHFEHRATEPDYKFIARLHATTVVAGTAVVVGHALMADHTTLALDVSATAAAERALTQTAPEPPLEAQATVTIDRRIEL